MTRPTFEGRVGIVQRVLPSYRVAFFDALAEACTGGVSVVAGEARPSEAIDPAGALARARRGRATNHVLFGGRFTLYRQAGIEAWLESWQPDVLVMGADPRALATGRAVRWMRRRGSPVVGWGLGAPAAAGPWSWLRRAAHRRRVLPLDGIIAYGQRGAREYRELGVPAERVFVAPNAVTPRPIRPPPEREATFTDGRATVLCLGRLTSTKRVDVLIRACAALPEHARARLLVVGDGPEASALHELAARCLPETTFLGALRGEALRPHLEAADLFVLPGTGGLALQEAMASGLPVIVAEGDGTQEDLVRPENGWTVAPGDVAALAALLETALSEPPRLREMGTASHRIVRDEIHLEGMVDAFVLALSGCLPRTRPGTGST